MAIKLTEEDIKQLKENNGQYFLEKGGHYYEPETYNKAVEYYTIGASIGNASCFACLGYCYMYGRGVEIDIETAISCFRKAADAKDIEALYKLGTFYHSGKYFKKDFKKALKCYEDALYLIDKEDDDYYEYHPSLCFTLGKSKIEGDIMPIDYYGAFILLNKARMGYEEAIKNGCKYYQGVYENTLMYLEDSNLLTYVKRCDLSDLNDYHFSIHPGKPVKERKYINKGVRLNKDIDNCFRKGHAGFILNEYEDGYFACGLFNKANKARFLETHISNLTFIPTIFLELYPGKLPIADSNFETGELHTGIQVIDENEDIKKANKEFGQLFKTMYKKIDSSTYQLDEKKMRDNQKLLIKLANKISKELKKVDDSSFVVIDEISNIIKHMFDE